MYFLLVLVVVAATLRGVQAACGDYHSCGVCTVVASCGWCSVTQQCLDGTETGPTGSVCLGAAWHKGVGSCRNCSHVTSCKQCVDYEADCVWCASLSVTKGSCRALNHTAIGCHNTDQCDCSLFGECSECLDGSNSHCKWCASTDSCVLASTPAKDCASLSDECPCNLYGACSTCMGDSRCAFCRDTTSRGGHCTEVAATNNCQLPLSCEVFCGTAVGCDDCNERPGCAYCSDTKTCVDTGFNHNCLLVHACPVNCGAYTTCEMCDATPCSWCSADNTCKMQGSDNCEGGFWAHTCSGDASTMCGFSGGSFVGGMFLIIGLLVLGVVGYFIYRWRSGQRIAYRELSG